MFSENPDYNVYKDACQEITDKSPFINTTFQVEIELNCEIFMHIFYYGDLSFLTWKTGLQLHIIILILIILKNFIIFLVLGIELGLHTC